MVSDLNRCAYKGCKMAAQKKKCFWANFALLGRIFLVLVFLTPFNGLFAPTSRSPMSTLFRYSESLGKSNGKKWSQIGKLLLIKGVKSPRKKKFVFFCEFCLTRGILVLLSALVERCFVSRMQDFYFIKC